MFKKNKTRVIRHASPLPTYKGIVPSRTVIPDWYKETPKHRKGEPFNRLPLETSFKACMPFLEAFTSGYVLTTPCDLGVDNRSESEPIITWNTKMNFTPIAVREQGVTGLNRRLPVPEGFSPLHFVWTTYVAFSIPKGYSALITHPLNRYDLPFVTLSGVIDGEFTLHFGSMPCFFNKTFNGIIPKGTPYAQVIPFKRESWESELDEEVLVEENKNQVLTRTSSSNWYRNTFWRKKSYN